MTFERFNPAASNWDDSPVDTGPTFAPASDARVLLVCDAIESLEQCQRPAHWSEARWHILLKDLRTIADKWLDIAFACGWSITDLFGAPPRGRRVDLTGVALLLDGRPIESIDENRIVIGNVRGAPNVFYWHAPGCSVPFDTTGSVPLWEVLGEVQE